LDNRSHSAAHGLFSYPENGGSISLQNVGKSPLHGLISQKTLTIALQPSNITHIAPLNIVHITDLCTGDAVCFLQRKIRLL